MSPGLAGGFLTTGSPLLPIPNVRVECRPGKSEEEVGTEGLARVTAAFAFP